MDLDTLKQNLGAVARIQGVNLKMYGGRFQSLMNMIKPNLYQAKYSECFMWAKEATPLLKKQQEAVNEMIVTIVETERVITTSQKATIKKKLEHIQKEYETMGKIIQKNKSMDETQVKTITTTFQQREEEDQYNQTSQNPYGTAAANSVIRAPGISLIAYFAQKWINSRSIVAAAEHRAASSTLKYTPETQHTKTSIYITTPPTSPIKGISNFEPATHKELIETMEEIPSPAGTIGSNQSNPDFDLLPCPETLTDTDSDIGECENAFIAAEVPQLYSPESPMGNVKKLQQASTTSSLLGQPTTIKIEASTTTTTTNLMDQTVESTQETLNSTTTLSEISHVSGTCTTIRSSIYQSYLSEEYENGLPLPPQETSFDEGINKSWESIIASPITFEKPKQVDDAINFLNNIRAKRILFERLIQSITTMNEQLETLKGNLSNCDEFERTKGRHQMVDWYYDSLIASIDTLQMDMKSFLSDYQDLALQFSS